MSTTVSTPRKIATTATAGATLAKGAHTPVNATSGAVTMTLPTDAAVGVVISVEKVDATGNAVTVSGTFRGTASTVALTAQYEGRTFLSEGTGSWRPTSDHRTSASLAATYARRDVKALGQDADSLRNFRTQLARREGAPVDVTFIGHSLIEGQGATARTKRGTDRFRDIMRSRFPVAGVAGGYGLIPYGKGTSSWTSDAYVTFSGGSNSSNYGANGNAYFVNASGAKVTLGSIVCTAVDVLYIQGGGGTFTTKTDGVANGDSKATTGTPTQMMAYRVPGITGAAAAHTVEVNFSAGNSIIAGFMVYNGDENAGIRVWNHGWSGKTSAQLLDPNNQNHADLATESPELVVISAFANDFKTSVPVATSKANLTSIVSQVRAKAPSASVVFNIEHALGSTGGTIPWADFVQGYYDVAATLGNVAVFDFYARIGTQTPPTAPGLIDVDNQHYTDAGYLMWAEALAGFVSP